MKKTRLFTLALLALTLCTPNLSAQKKKGKAAATKAKVETLKTDVKPNISTFSDSLSYALGNTIHQALKEYMTEAKLVIDTSLIISEYDKRIYNALSVAEATKIQDEMKLKLDSANKVNNQNIELFMKGFSEAMRISSETDAYESGKTMGSLMKITADNYKTQFNEFGGINKDVLIFAVECGMKNEEPIISTSIYDLMGQLQSTETTEIDQETQDRINEAKDFHVLNVLQDGVATTETGLQYKILKKGNGKIPELSDRVTVNYEGRYIDGTVFDSTERHGQPATFVVSQVVEGLSQALALMPEGSKWTVYIPYDLGYGDKQVGSIKPYSTLIFDIELIKIEADEE